MSKPQYDQSGLVRKSFRDWCDEITASGSCVVDAYASLMTMTRAMEVNRPQPTRPTRRLSFSGVTEEGKEKEQGVDADQIHGATGGLPRGLFEPLPDGTSPGSQPSIAETASVSDVGDLDLDLMLEESHDISSSESRFGDTATDPAGYSRSGGDTGDTGDEGAEGDTVDEGDEGTGGHGAEGRTVSNNSDDEEMAENDNDNDDDNSNDDHDGGGHQLGGDANGEGDATEDGGGQEQENHGGDDTYGDAEADHGDYDCSPGVTAVRENDEIGTFLISCADDADLRISNRIHAIAASAGDTVRLGLRRYAISDADMHHQLASAIHAYAQVIVNWYAGGAAGLATPFRYAQNIRRLTTLEPKEQIAAVSRPYRPALKYAIKYYMDYIRVLDYKRSKECIIHAIDNGYKAACNSRLYARKSLAREAAKAAAEAAANADDVANGGGGDDVPDGEPALEAFPAI